MSADHFCLPDENDLSKASELLKSLIRIDTSNPPGNEVDAVDFLVWELQSGGITPEVVGLRKDRPNLVARLAADPADRVAPPLVLSCHLDVVPAGDPGNWKYPPFSGDEAEGCIWGRGAIDMKGFAVMALMAILLLKKHHVPINRDVIFLAVSDEETGTDFGSKWIVENRPDLLGGAEYVINELGGFTVYRSGHRFYPVHVAEKGIAWLRLTAKGEPGHSSMAVSETSLSLIGDAISKISRATLPWHVTDAAMKFVEGFSQHESKTAQKVSKLMFSKTTCSSILKLIPDRTQRTTIESILRNTATPTRIQAGRSMNVLPREASVDIDGRIIPGQTTEDLIRELRKVIGDKDGERYSFEVLEESPGAVFSTDTPLYRAIEEVIGEIDPEASVIPSIIPGFTDSQNYAKLGITCYGFYPLKLPPEMEFAPMFHGDNERIPVEGFHWGIDTLMRLLGKFLTRRN